LIVSVGSGVFGHSVAGQQSGLVVNVDTGLSYSGIQAAIDAHEPLVDDRFLRSVSAVPSIPSQCAMTSMRFASSTPSAFAVKTLNRLGISCFALSMLGDVEAPQLLASRATTSL